MAHNWFAYCAICGQRELKRDLDRLRISAGAYGQSYILAYIHRECVPALADFLEAEVPEYVHAPSPLRLRGGYQPKVHGAPPIPKPPSGGSAAQDF